MRSAKRKKGAKAGPIEIAIAASSAALGTRNADSSLAALQSLIKLAPGEDAALFGLGRRLLTAAEASVQTDHRFRSDDSEAAGSECGDAWQKCEDIVAEIAALPAKGPTGLKLKALALDWTTSDTRDELRCGIVKDLRGMEDGALRGPATPSPGASKGDLESAIMDAAMFGQLAYNALCHLGFDKSEPPKLFADDSTLVYWAVCQMNWQISEAKAAFYGEVPSS